MRTDDWLELLVIGVAASLLMAWSAILSWVLMAG